MQTNETKKRLSKFLTEDQIREFYKLIEEKRHQIRPLVKKLRATRY